MNLHAQFEGLKNSRNVKHDLTAAVLEYLVFMTNFDDCELLKRKLSRGRWVTRSSR